MSSKKCDNLFFCFLYLVLNHLVLDLFLDKEYFCYCVFTCSFIFASSKLAASYLLPQLGVLQASGLFTCSLSLASSRLAASSSNSRAPTPSSRSRSSQPRHRTHTPFRMKGDRRCTYNKNKELQQLFQDCYRKVNFFLECCLHNAKFTMSTVIELFIQQGVCPLVFLTSFQKHYKIFYINFFNDFFGNQN